jgi:hypothetical protein
MRLALWIVMICLVPLNTYSAIPLPSETLLYVAANGAKSQGYLQIPSGGNPLTSLREHPTLRELGIHRVNPNFFQAGLKTTWQPYAFYVDYQYNHPIASRALSSNLLTHGMFFPANTLVRTKGHLDLYQLGVQRYFPIGRNSVIYPEAGLALLAFGYAVETSYQQTQRAFKQVTEQIGVGANYRLNRYLSFSFKAATSVPCLADFQLRTAQAEINFNLLITRHIQGTLFTGLGYEEIEFKDHQPCPNHIKVLLLPIGCAGIKFYSIP